MVSTVDGSRTASYDVDWAVCLCIVVYLYVATAEIASLFTLLFPQMFFFVIAITEKVKSSLALNINWELKTFSYDGGLSFDGYTMNVFKYGSMYVCS